MNRSFVEELLENLDQTAFPAINWNMKEVYITSLMQAIRRTMDEKDYILIEKSYLEELKNKTS